jgi:hypothetical protein
MLDGIFEETYMATKREEMFENEPLEKIADVMAGGAPGSPNDQRTKAEFMLRQTKAQIAAAQATEQTARYTRKYSRYMFWSIVVLALSALGNFILDIIKL